MKNLRILNCSENCNIADEDIKSLDLIELNAWNNRNIKNIDHFKNLKVLYCLGNCGISDEDIKGLDLRELYCSGNPKIKNIDRTAFRCFALLSKLCLRKSFTFAE